MKKYLTIAALFVLLSVQVSSASYLYSFSSGDVLDPNASPVYGIGRIDFGSQGIPYPTVVLSGDYREISLGSFTRSGKSYLYATKTDKHDNSPNSTTWFSVYNPSVSVSEPLNSEEYRLTVPLNPVASVDLTLPPNEDSGIIYAINGNTLIAYDLLDWNNQKSRALDSTYTAHTLVSLLPDSNNYLYIWSSERTNINASGDYTPVRSDIHVYNKDTLEEIAVFRHVRTGFDTTMKRADDEPTLEVGRGLVFAGKNKAVYVAYDTASANHAHANIVRLNEGSGSVTSEIIVKSSDINGWDVDIESPMHDTSGGIYFVAESGDVNAGLSSSKMESVLYHFTSDRRLIKMNRNNVTSNEELVIKEGRYKGYIFSYTIASDDSSVSVSFWSGNDEAPIVLGTLGQGVEIEKPFSDGANGFYFMMESKNEEIHDEYDTVYHWDGTSNAPVVLWSSSSELEVEEPPFDGQGGFYFVNVDVSSADMATKTMTSTMTLRHATFSGTTFVHDLGTFLAPPSTFMSNDKDPEAPPAEKFENEFAFLEDEEHSVMMIGAGPIGGKFKMTVMNWSNRANVTSSDFLVDYDDNDMGGNADLAGAVQFDERAGYRAVSGSNTGCDSGFGFIAFAGVMIFALHKRWPRSLSRG